MEYREHLPHDCPPSTAQQIEEPTIRYRLLEGAEPSNEDFESYVMKKGGPNPQISKSPCHQAGVSLLISFEAAKKVFVGHHNKIGRWKKIGEITIQPGAGKLDEPEPSGHQTWWPTMQFDAVANCKALS